MKIDIHNIDPPLLEQAMVSAGLIELTVNGTGADGTPACATVRVMNLCIMPAYVVAAEPTLAERDG
jgi:hypothetical protein